MPSSTSWVAIALGSNLGNREAQITAAIGALSATVSDLRVGGLYESEPVGRIRQPPYLNSAVVGHTHLDPEPLLAVLKFLECRAGRERGPRWGPRPLDLDLLLHGEAQIDSPALTLPHPQLHRRAFVLAPLADASPELELPPDGAPIEAVLAALTADAPRPRAWSSPPLGGR
jgi:2-amino-4-hydroxy-6-hydroxymethyldihydropteridine diphosphokinase